MSQLEQRAKAAEERAETAEERARTAEALLARYRDRFGEKTKNPAIAPKNKFAQVS